MTIESISNVGTFTEYKTGTKIQTALQTSGQGTTANSREANTVKQESSEEEKQKDAKANENRIKSVLDETNKKIMPTRTRCEFSYHEEVNRVSIKVRDVETDKVIREIPPEETIEMLQKLWEVAGLLVDEKR